MRGVFPLTSCSKTLRNKGFGSICLTWHCLWCVYCTRVNYTDAERMFCKSQCCPTMKTHNHDVGHVVFYETFLQCPGIKQCSVWLTSEVTVQEMPSSPHTLLSAAADAYRDVIRLSLWLTHTHNTHNDWNYLMSWCDAFNKITAVARLQGI